MPEIVQCKLTTRTSSGKLIRSAATLEYRDGRIWFLKSPFSLKEEIKAMRGSRRHGRDEMRTVVKSGKRRGLSP